MELLALTDAGRFVMVTGAACFGVVIGWFTYFVMRRAQAKEIKDIAALIGAVGGGAILELYDGAGPLFGAYAIGLLGGAALYFIVFAAVAGKANLKEWIATNSPISILGDERNPNPGGERRP